MAVKKKKNKEEEEKKPTRDYARERLGLPTTNAAFSDAFLTVSTTLNMAMRSAILKTFRRDSNLVDKLKSGDKVQLTETDVERLERGIERCMPSCVRDSAMYFDNSAGVSAEATKIFGNYSEEMKKEKIRKMLPNVLKKVCVVSEAPELEA